jgi:hypothetical protein
MARQDDATDEPDVPTMHVTPVPAGENARLREARETLNRIRWHSITQRVRELQSPKE